MSFTLACLSNLQIEYARINTCNKYQNNNEIHTRVNGLPLNNYFRIP